MARPCSIIHADSKRFRKPEYANAQRVVELLRFHAGQDSYLEFEGGESDLDPLLELTSVRASWQDVWPVCSEKAKTVGDWGTRHGGRQDQQQRSCSNYTATSKAVVKTRSSAPSSSRVHASRYSSKPLPKLSAALVDEVNTDSSSAGEEKLHHGQSSARSSSTKLKNIPLPTNMRSISETDTPVVRGTRIPIQCGPYQDRCDSMCIGRMKRM